MLFSDVIGQAAVKERLISGTREGRVSHALLFFGPKGSGTLPMARAFAQFLNCENPGESDSCGKCPSCIKSRKMIHPDIHFIYPIATVKDVKNPKSIDFVDDWRKLAFNQPYLDLNDWIQYIVGEESKQGFISAEESNDIIRKISLKSFEAPYKVVVIWMPEKLRIEAANKLLKSLEEPPDNTIFILASEQRDQLLATILSRTQLVKVNRLKDEEVADALRIKFDLQSSQALELARLADGDFRIALDLAAEERGEGSYEQEFLNWMRLCFNPMKSMEKLLPWVDEMAKEGRESQKRFLFSCMRMVRECMLVNIGDDSLVKLDDSQLKSMVKFLPFVNQNNMHPFIQALNEAHTHVERNANPKILFLDLSLNVSRILQIK
ncbi:DNA polymerase III subunit delta' [soil metagenome]